ncbi:hypothetical protein QJS10_CPB17g02543 [Acorus calamus]|uniref:Uncharacterized protein n=1 Tax=Acorus calamus TaxID=4465 RepID=A0AAV9CXV7_ACOCL|nr:hypothetical protein QJS10_CPB17g02543 [Acorus calamus]
MDDPNPGNSSEKDHPSLPMDDPNPGNSSGKGTACHPSLPRNEEGTNDLIIYEHCSKAVPQGVLGL